MNDTHKEEHKETHKQDQSMKGYLVQLEDFLDLYLVKKAPAIPKGGKEFIVKIAPWLVIIGAVFGVFAIFSLLGATAMVAAIPGAAVGMAAALGPTFYITLILVIAVLALEVIALPGLFARKKAGWTWIFYSTLVSAVSSLISMNLGGLIIGTLLSLYLLFQVREYYK